MINHKSVGEQGQRHTELQTSGLRVKGFRNTLEVDEIATSESPVESGFLIVEDSTNQKGALLSVFNDGGTPVVAIVAGNADISIAKDTAAKVNVYFEAGKFHVQNKTAAEAIVAVKTYS